MGLLFRHFGTEYAITERKIEFKVCLSRRWELVSAILAQIEATLIKQLRDSKLSTCPYIRGLVKQVYSCELRYDKLDMITASVAWILGKARQLRIASTLVYFRQGGTGIASDYLQRFAKICFSEPKIVNGFAIYELNGDFLITNTKTQGCTNKTIVSRFCENKRNTSTENRRRRKT